MARSRARIIIVTGGLGPTPDDITKNAIADFFSTRLILHKPTLEKIVRFFEGRGMVMPDINRNQAMVPESAAVMPNDLGTAPGLEFPTDTGAFYFLPGVPHEMKNLMLSEVIPRITRRFHIAIPEQHIFRTNGLPESALYKKIRDLIDKDGSEYKIAFLPKSQGVDVRIQALPDQKIASSFLTEMRSLLNKSIYSESEQSLPEVLASLLTEKKKTVAVAESFTGGVISDWITDIPGSSAFFSGSVVCYSNESKISLLSVSRQTIIDHGAVSEETAAEMVRGVKNRFATDCAIASTGIAGPGGATEQKPVGLCYLAAMAGNNIEVHKFNFGKDRRINKERGAAAGIELLRRLLQSG